MAPMEEEPFVGLGGRLCDVTTGGGDALAQRYKHLYIYMYMYAYVSQGLRHLAAGPLQWATLLGKKESGEDSGEDSEEDSGEDSLERILGMILVRIQEVMMQYGF